MSQYTAKQWREYRAKKPKGIMNYEAKRRAERKTVIRTRVLAGRMNFGKLIST